MTEIQYFNMFNKAFGHFKVWSSKVLLFLVKHIGPYAQKS